MSHKKAAAAQAAGKFKDEIVPVHTKVGCGNSSNLAPSCGAVLATTTVLLLIFPPLCSPRPGFSSPSAPRPPACSCPALPKPCPAPALPCPLQLIDPKTGVETRVVISQDDGIRVETTFESLSKLPTVFKKKGTTTAGSSSQVSREGGRRGGNS